MKPLTPRQGELLQFLRTYLAAYGVSPSFKEIHVGLGITSNGSVCRMLQILDDANLIRRKIGRYRSIEIVPSEDHHTGHCSCSRCMDARYDKSLQLVEAIKVAPPALSFDNIKPLSHASRLALVGARQTGGQARLGATETTKNPFQQAPGGAP